MSNPESRRPLVEGLVSQDECISEPQLKEFRMDLEKSLASLEEKAQASRRLTIRSAGIVTLCYVLGFIMNVMHGFTTYEFLAPIWSAVSSISIITCVVVAVRYWTQHRPALERGRIDLQIEMFGELQRQIAGLSSELKSQSK